MQKNSQWTQDFRSRGWKSCTGSDVCEKLSNDSAARSQHHPPPEADEVAVPRRPAPEPSIDADNIAYVVVAALTAYIIRALRETGPRALGSLRSHWVHRSRWRTKRWGEALRYRSYQPYWNPTSSGDASREFQVTSCSYLLRKKTRGATSDFLLARKAITRPTMMR
jgi:hypothetical protein